MKRQLASIAKITPPRVKGIFPRKRLFDLLDDSRNHPVTWISGPAGCGKTSLVVSYLDERKLPCIWYQVDEGDSDIASFFYYMGLALKKISRTRRPLPLLTPEYLQGVSTFTRRFFKNAFSRLKPSTVLVLDNYQLIPEDSGFHGLLLQGLLEIPQGLHFILISRTAPPPALVRLQANCLMQNLGWDHLRLTLKESAGIIKLRARKTPSKKTIAQLHMGADGWAVGLILMMESLKRGVTPHLLGKIPPEEIIHYFGNELFNRIDQENRDFLLKTAFLPKLTANMAEEITGLPHAGSTLSMLSRNNYFTYARHHTEPVYEYHPLFREFLIKRAREIFPQEVLSTLLRRTATLLEEAGHVEETVDLFADLKDWEELADSVMRHAPMLMARGRSQLLEKWINLYPEERLGKRPWLLYWLGVCRLLYSPPEARACFVRAFQLFEAAEEVAGAFLAWAGAVDSILYEWNEYKMLDPLIAWLDKRMEYVRPFPSLEIEARVASSMVGAILWRQTHRSDIEEWLHRALRSCREVGDNSLFLQNSMWATMYFNWRGEVGKLNFLYDEIRRMALTASVSPLAAIMCKFAEATYCHLSAPADPVLPISEALDIARTHGVQVMNTMLLAHGVYGSLCVGNMQHAEEFLKEIGATLWKGKRDHEAHYHFLSGWFHLIKGEISQATFHSERALELAQESGYPIPVTLCRHLRAHVFHQRGEHKQASTQLSIVKKLVLSSRCLLFEYVRLLTEAEFALDRDDERTAVGALRQAMALGNRQELRTMLFIWRPSVMARLCAKALEHGVEKDYVQDLICTHHLFPDPASLDIRDWPWSLKVYTFGRFGIVRDGKPIWFSRKTQEKPLFMLKALIALGGRDVRDEDLSDILWPEADGDAAHHSFQMALHRLRLLLGQPEALLFRDGRLTLDQKYCWVDAWAFERILGEADEKQEQGKAERAAELTQKAIKMYSGPFLSGEEEHPWVMFLRERLRSKFLRNVSWLGRHWERAEKWDKALECYQRGLEVDNLAEELYRRLMKCHQRLGQRSEALAVYNRCKKTLSSVLEIVPSPETDALYQTLRTNHTRSK